MGVCPLFFTSRRPQSVWRSPWFRSFGLRGKCGHGSPRHKKECNCTANILSRVNMHFLVVRGYVCVHFRRHLLSVRLFRYAHMWWIPRCRSLLGAVTHSFSGLASASCHIRRRLEQYNSCTCSPPNVTVKMVAHPGHDIETVKNIARVRIYTDVMVEWTGVLADG